MTTRRQIIQAAVAGAVYAPLRAFAQQQKVYRIAYLANDPTRTSPTFNALVATLRELGWVDGKNIEIKYLASGGRDERFAQLAAEAVRENVDVIVTTGSGSTRAAKAATDRIPIVFASGANPVEQKFVASLAKPGGNVTGLALMVQELGPKRLQLMKEMLPRATRFARLYQSTTPAALQSAIIEEDNAAAQALGLSLQHIGVATREEIESAFAAAARDRIDAINVKADALLVVNRTTIAQLALEHRLPIMCADGRFVEAGALMSYGENFVARYRRAAFIVDKVLRGTKPSEIPVEQSMNFEFVVNLRTAKTLGLTIPGPVMVQVSRVIKQDSAP
jgi:putative tryptophan/tyrosine transport system substrate-binding protein